MRRLLLQTLPGLLGLALLLSACGEESKPTEVSRIRFTAPVLTAESSPQQPEPTDTAHRSPAAPTPAETESPISEGPSPTPEPQPAKPEPAAQQPSQHEPTSEPQSLQPAPEDTAEPWPTGDTEKLPDDWPVVSYWTPMPVWILGPSMRAPRLVRHGPPACDLSVPDDLSVPGITGAKGTGNFASLCLYGFDPDEQMAVHLYDPTGNPVATAIFRFSVDEDGDDVVLQLEPQPLLSPVVGYASTGDETTVAQISVWLPAGSQPGPWQVQVATPSIAAETTLEVPAREEPAISILPSADVNPFQRFPCPSTSTGSQVTVRGAGFQPDTEVWLGLYYVRLPGGLANMPEGSRVWFRRLAAQPVTIDREGELSVPLPIPWPDAGSYFVLSSVNEPGTIFRTRGPLDPRIGCFTLASAGILTLDSFESFGSDAALQSAYGINDAWGQNRAWLEVATPPHVSGGQRAAAFNYIIQQDAPDDYAGFERTFPAQDWRRYTTLHLWMESDRADIQLVVQFGESGGEVWRHRKYILSAGRSLLDLRLNEDTFSWADWSPQGNGRIDLEAVDYIGFFIGEAGQKSGTLYVDEIELR